MQFRNLYNNGPGSTVVELHDYVMLPNMAHRPAIEIRVAPSVSGGVTVAEFFSFQETGIIFGMNERTLSPEQLGDLYEVMHHRLHGHDARGLDPRNGPTRLTLPERF